MPYATANDLPAEVRDALPPAAQEVYRAAFNEADQTTCRDADDREGCSSRIAWDAVRRQYRQEEGGQWAEIANVATFSPPEAVAAGTHEAILQGLDQWLPTPHAFVKGGKTFLARRNFEGTETAWDQVPLIFVPGRPVHPNTKALREDAATEIVRVGGRVVGGLAGTAIAAVGTPHMKGALSFNDDEVQDLHAAGHLGLSTSFDALTFPSGHMAGQVIPSHVLLFDLRKGLPPNDPRTMFLNVGDSLMADDTEVKGLLSQILDGIKGLKATPAAHANTAPDDSARLLEQANLAKKKADEDLAAANARLLEFENLEKQRAKDAADARWLEVKNTLPAGLTAKPEDEAKERQAFEADPAGYAVKMIHANTKRAPDQAAQGATHANMGAPQKTDEEQLGDLGFTSLTVSGGEPA